jgi:hypothetical protein
MTVFVRQTAPHPGSAAQSWSLADISRHRRIQQGDDPVVNRFG